MPDGAGMKRSRPRCPDGDRPGHPHPPVARLARLNLRELWSYRELIFFIIWRDVKVRYKQTLLRAAWAILKPFLTMVIFNFVFDRLASVPTDGYPDPIFSYAGLLPWSLFQEGVTKAGSSLVTGANLITKIYFPRLSIPLASVVSGLVDFGLSLRRPGRDDGLLRRPVLRPPARPAAVHPAGPRDGARGRAVAFGDERHVPGRRVRRALPVQAWMYASPIAYSVNLITDPVWRGLRPQPDGGSGQGIPLGPCWEGRSPAVLVLEFTLVSLLILVSGALTSGEWNVPSPTWSDMGEHGDPRPRTWGSAYRHGLPRASGYRTLRDALRRTRSGRSPRPQPAEPSREILWALADVSLRGRRAARSLGIIGRNGAGQEHAAQDPLADHRARPRARREIRGRVGSLLEVGTGFHPELTGRENIFLNGAILGMKRAEIDAQVRRDRRLRRGRAVHRHAGQALLERACTCGSPSPWPPTSSPRSCSSTRCSRSATPSSRGSAWARWSDVAAAGRTVLFVSHNMAAVLRLTQETHRPGTRRPGPRAPTPEAVDYYLTSGLAQTGERALGG